MKNIIKSSSIPLKWVALFCLVTGLFTAIGFLYYRYEANRITEDKYLEMSTIAKLKSDFLEEWRKRLLADVHRVAIGPLVKREVERLIQDSTNLSAIEQLKIQLDINRKGTLYEDALFLDKNGAILLSDNPNPVTSGETTIKAIDAAIQGHTDILSNLFRAPNGNIYIDAVTPISNSNGQFIAVAVLRSNADDFLFPLIKAWPTPTKSAETLLVCRDGNSVLFLNELRHKTKTALNLRFSLNHTNLPAVQAVLGNHSRFYGYDYRGIAVLSVSKSIHQSNWSIIAKIDASEIMAEVRYRAWVTAIIIFLLIVITSGLIINAYRKSQNEKVKKIEAIHSALVENIPQRMFLKDKNMRYLFVNTHYANDFGLSPADFVGKDDYSFFLRNLADKYRADDTAVLSSGQTIDIEENYIVDDKPYWVHTIKTAIKNDKGEPIALIGLFSDISDRKKAEDEKEKLNAQLIQSQKMESVGRLAGGVAHDYNNMLSVIIGYSELVMEKLSPTNTLRSDIEEILKAAKRSADITRQLLAFSRQQTIAPKPIDLNEAVKNMLKMLQRLIGEDIQLVWHPDADLWPVKVDSTQLDQVLANLCVNARDAITDVGRITIETKKRTFDEAYCANHLGFVPGDFVLLSVSDNGCGMDKDTQLHLFEPFFTTKAIGKGTGLGLATIYGIVKQNDGFINVYSEPGHGTIFSIYLPKYKANEAELLKKNEDSIESNTQGNETVLLIEDEKTILKMVAMMLEQLGYVVLMASTPREAINLAHMHTGEIHLLFTDVVMPGMNGRELANRIQEYYPNIKILFMSGYTANVIANRGVLYDGVNFIQKPFSKKDLSDKIREVLDSTGKGRIQKLGD